MFMVDNPIPADPNDPPVVEKGIVVAFAFLMESRIAASRNEEYRAANPEQVSLFARSRNWMSARPTRLQCSVCGNQGFGGPMNIPNHCQFLLSRQRGSDTQCPQFG